MLHCGVNQSSGLISKMDLNVPQFSLSVDARVFMVVSYLETLNFVLKIIFI